MATIKFFDSFYFLFFVRVNERRVKKFSQAWMHSCILSIKLEEYKKKIKQKPIWFGSLEKCRVRRGKKKKIKTGKNIYIQTSLLFYIPISRTHMKPGNLSFTFWLFIKISLYASDSAQTLFSIYNVPYSQACMSQSLRFVYTSPQFKRKSL